MSDFRIDVEMKKLSKNFDKLIKVVSTTKTEALEEVGHRGITILKRNTPTDTSRLKNSMSFTIDNRRFNTSTADFAADEIDLSKKKDTVSFGTNVDYVIYVERRIGMFSLLENQLKRIAKKIVSQFYKDVTKKGF